MKTLDKLIERDNQREKDGFPKKIRMGKIVKSSKNQRDKVVVVPSTVEEKFKHGPIVAPDDDSVGQGSGEGEEGEVIGEQPIHEDGDPGQTGPGQGSGGEHEIESSAYDLGKILTENFELPNLQDKGKKAFLGKYSYELTDRHRGSGQLLDKKATMREIIKTNIVFGNIPDINNIDPEKLLIAPRDRIFRVLSREKEYESQALVFFLRDYSGSMAGDRTVTVVTQHVFIYSWLIYQYARKVETRFIVHDTEAKEVDGFHEYFSLKTAGGTRIKSAFELLNQIVKKDNLASDYNIYVFYGTDGDDWDAEGKETIPVIDETLSFVNRAGFTVVRSLAGKDSEFEAYMKKSGLKITRKEQLRINDLLTTDSEQKILDSIKFLVS